MAEPATPVARWNGIVNSDSSGPFVSYADYLQVCTALTLAEHKTEEALHETKRFSQIIRALGQEAGIPPDHTAQEMGDALLDKIEALTSKLTLAEQGREEAERQRNDLLARIFRDGGQHQATYPSFTEACEAAEALLVTNLPARAERSGRRICSGHVTRRAGNNQVRHLPKVRSARRHNRCGRCAARKQVSAKN